MVFGAILGVAAAQIGPRKGILHRFTWLVKTVGGFVAGVLLPF